MGTSWVRVGAKTLGAAVAVVAVLLGTATSASALPGAQVGGLVPNPWGCVAQVSPPHPADGAIEVHGTVECRDQAPSSTASVVLYGSQWYGWGEVDRQSRTVESDRFLDAAPRWNPGLECHHYRGTGSFRVTGDGRTYDAPLLVNYDQRFLGGQSPGCGVNWL